MDGGLGSIVFNILARNFRVTWSKNATRMYRDKEQAPLLVEFPGDRIPAHLLQEACPNNPKWGDFRSYTTNYSDRILGEIGSQVPKPRYKSVRPSYCAQFELAVVTQLSKSLLNWASRNPRLPWCGGGWIYTGLGNNYLGKRRRKILSLAYKPYASYEIRAGSPLGNEAICS